MFDSNQEVLKVRGLTKTYRSGSRPLTVLDDVGFPIMGGDTCAIVGPSGSGKTTLLGLCAGLDSPSAGSVTLCSHPLGSLTEDERAEVRNEHVGFVFQSFRLIPTLTAIENVMVPAELQGRYDVREEAATLLRDVGLGDRYDHFPSQLSGGQRQRVAIGRALVRDVDVFLFDEPLSNLDAQLRSELRVEIKRLHARLKNTMIYVTHDQIEALTLADRIAVMKGGVIQQLAAPQLIYNKPSNLYVAGFIGSPAMNFLPGQLVVSGEQASFTTKDGASISLQGYEASTSLSQGGEAILGVRPEHIQIHTEPIPGVTIPATVEIDEPMGADSLLWLKLEQQSLSVRIDADLNCQEGTIYHLEFNIPKSSIFRKDTENRI